MSGGERGESVSGGERGESVSGGERGESVTDLIPDGDRWLLNSGNHHRLFDLLGAQPLTTWSEPGRRFAVWAPSAAAVWIVGDFNGWDSTEGSLLVPQGSSGIWALEVEAAAIGDRYKFRIKTPDGSVVERADPLAFAAELPPATGSVVTDLSYDWSDAEWLDKRATMQNADAAISIYEMHVGSWRHAEAHRSLTWLELIEPLADHLDAYGFTHVELLPIMEYPFYGSWGYQTTGFFAPTARFGLPTEFMAFVDGMHQRGLGIILDWVPSHFPSDDFALANFDGTHLYEHADPKEGWHPDWKSYIFNYGRHEVRSFLVSSAMSWIDRFHVDGIRVDAVASMLYRDYSRNEGEWVPNIYGGRENLEAIEFLRELNSAIGANHPEVITIAEESTAFPGVTRPVADGGLGFHYKWDMGWMHDTLQFMERDPIHRTHHHDEITFRSLYAFSEHYVMPLSHDEVTHGKGSILAKMPGDTWQQFANLRVLYANQWLNPGKKLLFMGQEFGQGPEWNHDAELSWNEAEIEVHAGIARWVKKLNDLYRSEPSLHRNEQQPASFEWVVRDDRVNSVLAWIRRGVDNDRPVLVVTNLTPVPREHYVLGVPVPGEWEMIANSDAIEFGGSGTPVPSVIATVSTPSHGRENRLTITLPPLATAVFAPHPPG